MYDQSFNYISISRMLRKNDFYVLPRLKSQAVKEIEIEAALTLISKGFAGYNLLSSTTVKNKYVYRVPKFGDELVLRKIDRNLRKAKPSHAPSRDTIVAKLKNLLSESVQSNIYRLDIQSFYESFDNSLVLTEVNAVKQLSSLTKTFIKEILDNFNSVGGQGLPRGLALSATLSEMVMSSFDNEIKSMCGVFLYCRYVDDIIIITSGVECPKQFINKIKILLPNGLYLNDKKGTLCKVSDSKKISQIQVSTAITTLEYLGYSFSVFETAKNKPRKIVLDIANSKVNKIKTRITRAYIDFCKNKDFNLLEMRLKFLTSNYSVIDINRGGYRLAGIYHNYHRIDSSGILALEKLDEYLKKATLSRYGKVFNNFYRETTSQQRRRLLGFSFKNGFYEKVYLHFNRSQFKKIRECWEYV